MPVIRIVKSAGSAVTTGAGSSAAGSSAAGCGRPRPGITVRNDGQAPSRHEKSRLHDDWLIWVLRPYFVCTGWTDRQLDFVPQSPQPSHTRSLISTRSAG